MKKPNDYRKKRSPIADGFIKLGIFTVLFGTCWVLFFSFCWPNN